MGSRTGLDGYEKILHHGDSIPGGSSQSLYRLSYPELLMMHRLSLLILHQNIFNFLYWLKRTQRFTVLRVKQAEWSGPEGSRKLRFLDYMTTAQDGGKVVSLT